MKPLEITIQLDAKHTIKGDLTLVHPSTSLVIFALARGNSRFNEQSRYSASVLQQAGMSTLLVDLLTQQEDEIDHTTKEFRFDIRLLAQRLVIVTKWVLTNPTTADMRIGYVGTNTGAAAAIIAAAEIQEHVVAIVSCNGRPDLADHFLHQVQCPTLLIVGQLDTEAVTFNKRAYEQITATKELLTIPNTSHLFEEEGTLEQAARAIQQWFSNYLK